MKPFVRKQCETMHIRWLLRRDHDWAAIAVALDVWSEESKWTYDRVALIERGGERCLVEIDDVIDTWDILESYPSFAHQTGPSMSDHVRNPRSLYARYLAEALIKDVYEDRGWPTPSFSWFPSPKAAARFVRRTVEADAASGAAPRWGRNRRRSGSVGPTDLRLLLLAAMDAHGMDQTGSAEGARRREVVADAIIRDTNVRRDWHPGRRPVTVPVCMGGTLDVDLLEPVARATVLQGRAPECSPGSTDLIHWTRIPTWLTRLAVASALMSLWWPMERMVVASDLPVLDGLTADGDAQYVLEYRDGWRVYVDDDGDYTRPPSEEPRRWG